LKRIITTMLVLVILVLPMNTLAADFADMPEDWSTEVLEKAVENGLLKGSDGKIMPKDNLTRAQMATVVNRSFGAYKEASLARFNDVRAGEWYYTEMAKAVNMGTFEGSNNMLNPNESITREQVFVVIARALKIEPIEEYPAGFEDLDQISTWAKGEIYAMIEAGYIQGSNNMLNPKAYVTRAEFAKLQDNIVKEYISLPGEYTSVAEGNVMINSKDVVLKDVVIEGDLIIGDGVADGDVTLVNVKVKGRMVVRGGGEDSIKIIKEKTTDKRTESSKSEESKEVVVPEVTKPVETKPVVTVPETSTPKITSAFNQAYQENYSVDSLAKIESNARNAYVLLDPDSSASVNAISKIKANNNVVAAYISVGSGENWRSDFNDLKPFLVSKQWGEWAGEYFVNEVTTGILPVMKKRIDRIASLGFDWIEFDNMDWAFDSQMRREYGFKATEQEAIAYYQELARYANSLGLKVMAKNTGREADLFEGITCESYNDDLNWWSESEFKDFLAQGKLGLIVHYKESNPEAAYKKYQDIYGKNLLFMAESTATKEYVNFVITGN